MGASQAFSRLLLALLMVVSLSTGATAQDTSHVLRDTSHLIHITVDTAPVDSLALDTLRRAVIRDSLRGANRRDSAKNAKNCQGRIITAVVIRPQPPAFFSPSTDPRVTARLRRLNALHFTTRRYVIRRFLAFQVGNVCTEPRRLESERLLRAQPFLDRVRISAIRDGPNGVRMDVLTVDAFAAHVGLSIESRPPLINLLALGNGNLLGSAIRVDGLWSFEEGYRDQFSGQITDYAFLGHPWVADVRANLAHVGQQIDGSVSHPYFTNLQRTAWRVAAGNLQNYFEFVRPGSVRPALDFQQSYASAGGLFRLGSPSRFESTGPTNLAVQYSQTVLIGAALSHESNGIAGQALDLTGRGPVSDTTVGSPPFGGRYAAHNVRRVNGLAGFRALHYMTVRGFESLLGEEDVPIGVQASSVVGRSVPWFGGAGDPDIFVSGRMDMGAGNRRSVVQAGLETEARRDLRTGAWDGLIASAHGAWYYKPTLAQTLIFTTDAALGRRVIVPFELTLSDPLGGVEGYDGAQVAGGVRAVGRAEYRHLFRMPWSLPRSAAAWGLAGFATTGRIWNGGVPYGATSPVVASAGASLLVGLPIEARQLWRLDVAAPLVPEVHTGWVLRISSISAVRLGWLEPRDVSRSREQTVSPNLFGYP